MPTVIKYQAKVTTLSKEIPEISSPKPPNEQSIDSASVAQEI